MKSFKEVERIDYICETCNLYEDLEITEAEYQGKKVKLIRFGQQGVRGAGKKPSTKAQKARRRSFKARHRKNIAKGKMSAAYWANKVKW